MVGPRGWISDGRTVESSSPVIVSRGRISGGWIADSDLRSLDSGVGCTIAGRDRSSGGRSNINY